MKNRNALVCLLPVFVGAALCGGVSGCASSGQAERSPDRRADLTSDLQIEVGRTFVYAGEGAGAFRVSVANVGDAAVSLARRAGTVETPVGELPPGASGDFAFAPGQAALLRNLGNSQARLRLFVWGDTNVEMRYEPSGPAR